MLRFCLLLVIAHCFALSTTNAAPTDWSKADTLRHQARILGFNYEWEACFEHYTQAIAHYQDPSMKAYALIDWNAFKLTREDVDAAAKLASLEAVPPLPKTPSIQLVQEMSYLYFLVTVDSLEKFQQYYQQLEPTLSKTKDRLLISKLYTNLAAFFYYNGALEPATTYAQLAEHAAEHLRKTNSYECLDLYNTLTAVYFEHNAIETALRYNLKSISVLEQIPLVDTTALAYEYNNLGSIYASLADESNAIFYFEKALSIVDQYSGAYPPEDRARYLNNLLVSQKEIRNYEGMLEGALENVAVLEALPQKNHEHWYDLITAYNLLTSYYISHQRLDSAVYYNALVRQYLHKNEFADYEIHRSTAAIFFAKKNFEQYLVHIDKAIEAAQYTQGPGSQIALKMQLDKITDLSNARLIHDHPQLIQEYLIACSEGFHSTNLADNPTLEQVVDYNDLVAVLPAKIKVLMHLYEQSPSLERIDAIYTSNKLAIQAMTALNRTFKNPNSKRLWLNENAIVFYEQAIGTAHRIFKFTGEQRYLREAFQLCEQSKSMMLMDVFQEQLAAAQSKVPTELIQRQVQLEGLVAEAQKQWFDARTQQDPNVQDQAHAHLFQVKQELDRLRHQLALEYPEYDQLRYHVATTTVQAVQDLLHPGDCLIEYFEGKSIVFCFIITKEGLQVRRLDKDALYDSRLEQFQFNLVQMKPYLKHPTAVFNNYLKDAHRLYQLLLAPLQLDSIQRLIIVPDGKLSYLPFEVLLTEARQPVASISTKGANFTNLPYLLRHCPINYLYSAQVWIQQQQKEAPSNNGKILGFAPIYQQAGVPDWRQQREATLRKTLIDLPGAQQEVQWLRQHYAGHYALGAPANEAQFKAKAGQYSVLHLAMHGLIDKNNPQYSGLALHEDQSETEDNFLYAYEIKQLPLSADLVVLSACETGIGKYQRGEGVVSIGRSFIYAGAPALLMTLWNLNDQSGAFIMERFYQNLKQGMAKDVAIQQAKLAYLQQFPPEYAHPFMWAAFVSVGDYSPIALQTKIWLGWYWMGAGLLLLLLAGLWYGLQRTSKKEG